MKKRVLVGGDTSTANSGFAVYKKHLLKGLMDSNLFEVAEVGNGGYVSDKERVPWKYYPTGVKPDDERYKQYTSNPANEYGVWRWDKICLNFRPTHCCNAGDAWNFAHEATSALKPYYHWIISPTVDSVPQRIDFLQIYNNADSLLSYTKYAQQYLLSCGFNCLDHIGMGVNTDIFKPVDDKKALRKKFNLPEDAIIFGFVARNQMRKKFPDIMESFALYLKKVPKEIADKSYLYLHTSFPDQGWDLPMHLLENNVINKVLFTYYCQQTKKTVVSTFKGARMYSPFSRQLSCVFPNVANSPTDVQLAEIYNLMDYYIQPATCCDGNTPIFTMTGWKNINEVQEGEYVFTHKNRFKKVLTRFENRSPDKIFKIQVYGLSDPLLVTADHKLLKHDHNSQDVCKTPVSQLTKNDYLIRPRDLEIYTNIQHINIDKYLCKYDTIQDNTVFSRQTKIKYYRNIKISKELCRFLGLFAADGSASGADIKITSHKAESININLANRVMKSFGRNLHIHNRTKGENGYDVILSSKRHSKLFKSLFYNHDGTKTLPDWYLNISKDLQKELLYGLFLGDGHSKSDGRGYFSTTSISLAHQVEHILLNNGFSFGVTVKKRPFPRKPHYRFNVTHDIKRGHLDTTVPIKLAKTKFYDGKVLLRIKSIEEIDYSADQVYTLEVEEDHTYVTPHGINFNCEGWGSPIPEAASCNLPVIATDYSAMAELTRAFGGLPVKPGTLNYEHGVMARRASMDIEGWADAMVKYALEKPTVNSREIVLQKYTWTHIIDKWIHYIEQADMPKLPWGAPIRQYEIPKPEGNMSITQFINILSRNIPQLEWGILNLASMRSINNQMELNGKQMFMINPQIIQNKYAKIIENINICEQIRVGQQQLKDEDFLL